ncbi:MAG: hypothetical protein GTO18_17135 [Anaerolineales bacterium]|nr:hypothetical protein [Anaerolineales bacterium]
MHYEEQQREHTAAVLAFAYHSQKRNWQVEFPQPVEVTRAQPDALVRRNGDSIYIEVELGEDNANKWRNMAELQGFVALCAATEATRERQYSIRVNDQWS